MYPGVSHPGLESNCLQLEPLRGVLQEKYGFSVQYRRMHMQLHPQLQATKHVADFVFENDGPRGLLIVYYAGHGWAEDNSVGRISLSGRFPVADNEKDMSIEWNEVEHTLGKTTSDVLVIFDCCHAGLLCRPAVRGRRRSFYYVAACKEDQVTRSCGRRSFTTAMIWALEQLAHSSGFTVTKLVHKLMEYENFPRDEQEAVVYPSRFGPGAEIWIAPKSLKQPDAASFLAQDISPNSKPKDATPTTSILDLRFHFSHHASPDHIEETAMALKDFLETRKSLRFHRITFIDHTSLIEGPARHWLRLIREKRSARDSSAMAGQQDSLVNSKAAMSSLSRRLSQLDVLRTSDGMLASTMSTTAVASPAARLQDQDIPCKNAGVASGKIFKSPNMALCVLVGCVALFGFSGRGMFRLTWASGNP